MFVSFGARIRDLREQHGLSLRRLETLIGGTVTHSMIHWWETGKNQPPRDPVVIKRLARALKTDPIELIVRAGVPASYLTKTEATLVYNPTVVTIIIQLDSRNEEKTDKPTRSGSVH